MKLSTIFSAYTKSMTEVAMATGWAEYFQTRCDKSFTHWVDKLNHRQRQSYKFEDYITLQLKENYD